GTEYEYSNGTAGNEWGNLERVVTGTRATGYVYDAHSRVSAVISPGQDTARTEYDLLNRVVKSTDPAGKATEYEYRSGNLYRITNPKSEHRYFHHNPLGWLESEVDPRNQWTYYGFDRAGNSTSTTNRRGQVITQGFNELNQPIWRDADGQRTTWGYDPSGRWVSASNPNSTADRLDFDVAGRMVQESSRGYVITSQYNLRGQRTEVRMAQGPRVVKYGYNARGQLETLTDLNGGVTTLGYNDDGQETGRILPTALVVGRNYPSTHTEANIVYHDEAVNQALGRSYRYNANGIIGQERRRFNDIDISGDRVRTYSYDRLSRVTGYEDLVHKDDDTGSNQCAAGALTDANQGACMPAGGTIIGAGRATYSYDAQGNRTDPGSNAVVAAGDRLTSFNGFTLEYDADGNLTRKYRLNSAGVVTSDQKLTWNSLGQLTAVWTSGVGDVRFAYDGWGRRIVKSTPSRNHYYIYDGEHVFVEGSDCCWEAEMTYYPGTDRPHSIRRNGQMFYYQTYALGSVTGLVNSSNQLVNRYQYTPWGELVSGESTYTTYDPLGFTARERDDETRLYYYRARYYDPQLGRFISEDPIGLAGGPNVYAYVNNNPINNTDPTGLWCAAGPVYSATCGMCELRWRRVDGVCQSDRGRGYGDIARTG
ncbi:MAG TPA: RHS repeat-associated core domain-containing protein, partial [Longimicrobium sp.]|nr:RHS repeat-associated core domain-containing protein [Longimicrobium sp.]